MTADREDAIREATVADCEIIIRDLQAELAAIRDEPDHSGFGTRREMQLEIHRLEAELAAAREEIKRYPETARKLGWLDPNDAAAARERLAEAEKVLRWYAERNRPRSGEAARTYFAATGGQG